MRKEGRNGRNKGAGGGGRGGGGSTPVSELGDLAVEAKNLVASVAAMKYRALIIRVLRTTPALELALTLESHRPARGGGGGVSQRRSQADHTEPHCAGRGSFERPRGKPRDDVDHVCAQDTAQEDIKWGGGLVVACRW